MSATTGTEATKAPGRPELTRLTLNLIVTAYLLSALNGGLWSRMAAVFDGSPLALAGFALAVAGLTMVTLSLVSLPRLHRPALAALILVAAGADYFQRAYGILIDREMIQNAMLTTATESKHLMTADLALHLGLFGLLPAALVFVPRIRPVALRHVLWRYPLMLALSFGVLAGALMSDFKTYSAAVREHRDMMGAYQPGATLAAAARYAKLRYFTTRIVTAPFGRDATPGPFLAAAPKPVLLVVFAGETARAQNFGLNGYGRDTTPELAKLDVVNFPDTWSCGTSTAVSLPCMFSALGQEGYSQQAALAQENLLDVLSHAGLDVQWFDNNTGDQGIGKRTGSSRIDATVDPAACAGGECTDAALLPILQRTMQAMTRDTVLVLHMIGSHGPAYYLRYPPEEARFTPDCRSASFADCTGEEIVNAYDNSIRFTDHVLGRAIRMMGAQDRVIPAMVFMSDHGESLGEGGLYLHAAPMFMAPDTQRKVPFVIWLSEGYQATMGVSHECLARKAAQPQSHDVLFHTVLGLMDIRTTVRGTDLDLTADCRETTTG
ncbi:MAG: hypothetical protein RIR62_588 [Pseudomonadota bacterium]|jgi:lipid A ethanolaminephosphotransferase